MTATKTLDTDPSKWLLTRLNEAYQVDPEASFADGFEYALGCIDLGIAVEAHPTYPEEVPPMARLLDTSVSYAVWAPDECHWKFEYKPTTYGYGRPKWGWEAFRKRPGADKFISQGDITELEIINRLTLYGQKLNENDRDDLIFFTRLGGLEEFLRVNRIPLEEEEN